MVRCLLVNCRKVTNRHAPVACQAAYGKQSGGGALVNIAPAQVCLRRSQKNAAVNDAANSLFSRATSTLEPEQDAEE